MPFAPPNLLIYLDTLGSNPTLSAILFKINELLESQDPLSGSLFVFGMSDMQFRMAKVRAVKPGTD